MLTWPFLLAWLGKISSNISVVAIPLLVHPLGQHHDESLIMMADIMPVTVLVTLRQLPNITCEYAGSLKPCLTFAISTQTKMPQCRKVPFLKGGHI